MIWSTPPSLIMSSWHIPETPSLLVTQKAKLQVMGFFPLHQIASAFSGMICFWSMGQGRHHQIMCSMKGMLTSSFLASGL